MVARKRSMEPEPTRPLELIEMALADGAELFAHQIMKNTGLEPSEFYRAAIRLEFRGKIQSRWEDGDRPRRRLYRREGNV